jgi:hypothetical protein
MGDSILLQQLIPQIPLLMVYLAGMVLAVVFWGRASGPAIMTVLGCGVLITTTLVMAFVYSSMFERLREGNMTNEQFAQTMRAIGMVGSAGRAGGLLLIIIAVFTGRTRPQPERTGATGGAA